MLNAPIGTIVKFAKPQTEDEKSERFEVVEDRDTRVLVADNSPAAKAMTFRPTSVYLWSDLTPAED